MASATPPALALALSTLLGACTPSAHSLGLTTHTLEHGGRERTFHVHLPPGHSRDRPAPLLVSLHGGGGQGLLADRATDGKLHAEADRRGWVVVAPEGVERGWNDGRPLASRRDRKRAGVDDVGFISALIDRMQRDHGIDPSRVYATGISNGGFMSMRLAIDLSDRLAAVAAVAASLAEVHAELQPVAPIAVMMVNGTGDPVVPYGGGEVEVLGAKRGRILSTDASARWWREHDGCSGPVQSSSLPDTDPGDGTRVVVETAGGCRDGSSVVVARVEGGGHTWPGGLQYLPRSVIGTVSRDVSGPALVIDFLAAHAR